MRSILHRSPRTHHRMQDQMPAPPSTVPPSDNVPGLALINGEWLMNGNPHPVSFIGSPPVINGEKLTFAENGYWRFETVIFSGDAPETAASVHCFRMAMKIDDGDSVAQYNFAFMSSQGEMFVMGKAGASDSYLYIQDSYGGAGYVNVQSGWTLFHFTHYFSEGDGAYLIEVHANGVPIYGTWWDLQAPGPNTRIGALGVQSVLQLTCESAGIPFCTNSIPDYAAEATAWTFPT